ncbi:hypothetical protein MSIMFB_05349 [Mycobacterium simulans]|uniref:Uncharacterized protein n=1 Tax=Mycobacterium simulans TaxID=627089 RepID=A0A7Z7IQD8_9MYCO|nr:hypothetical protein MSIMFB_05349 [Mycobacterium simulans]
MHLGDQIRQRVGSRRHPCRVGRFHLPTCRPVTMEYVTTAIVVTTLVLLGIGIVINELLRLRKWLKRSPPAEGDAEPPEAD